MLTEYIPPILNLIQKQKKYSELTQLDLIAKNLKVMDRTASSLSMDTHIPLIVFNVNTEGNIKKVVLGDHIGTIIEGGK